MNNPYHLLPLFAYKSEKVYLKILDFNTVIPKNLFTNEFLDFNSSYSHGNFPDFQSFGCCIKVFFL